MNQINALLHRTALRAALVLSGLLALAIVLGALLTVRFLESGLTLRLEEKINERMLAISDEYAGGDQRAFTAIVVRHVSLGHDRSIIYQVRTNSGDLLLGNMATALPPPGASTIRGESIGKPDAGLYHLLRRQVDDMDLVVGLSDSENREIRQLVYPIAALASFVTLLVLLGGGSWLALRAQRRLDHIGLSLKAVAGGKLSTRVTLSGRADDIDTIAIHVNTMLDELESLVAAVDQMSSDIAHDLKTPITHLFVSLEEAREQAIAGKPVVEMLDEAKADLLDINATFDAMLRLSRIESRARRDHFLDVEMSTLIRLLVEHWSPVAEENAQSLVLDDRSDGIGKVRGDKDLLTQLVVNLLSNAFTHCPSGAHIKLTVENSAQRFCLQVADDGPGIPFEEREHVFRRLYRLDRSRSTPGFGIGLSLVRAITTLHGGTVTLTDNAPGLVVIIDLPRVAA